MTAETKAPLPDAVRDAALKALHDLESNDYWRRGDFSDCHDKIRAHIAAQDEKIALLKGAARADEQRLQDAGHRVNINAGCDTPEMMADRILELEADNKRLREALEWIKANWANQDICHTDFRVRSFVEANTAIVQSDGNAGER